MATCHVTGIPEYLSDVILGNNRASSTFMLESADENRMLLPFNTCTLSDNLNSWSFIVRSKLSEKRRRFLESSFSFSRKLWSAAENALSNRVVRPLRV